MARGGKREGAGRPAGTPNKATQSIRTAAQEFSNEALQALVGIMRSGDGEAARIAAAKEILDRAHGKSTQGLEMSGPEGGPIDNRLTVEFVSAGKDT